VNKRRVIIAIVIIVALLLVVGYVGASVYIYNQLSRTVAGCGVASDREFTPEAFTSQTVETEPYLMPDYQEVTFTSRGDGIQLDAWYIPAEDEANAPAVVLIHGLTSCKRSASVLIPAGMLHRAGYSVLIPDLRDHGDSQVEDGRYAAGSEEWRDALGAWDWLVNERDIPEERIGMFGVSLGAATAMIATGEEPRVAALWEDSGFASIQTAVDAELTRNGFPTFLSIGALTIGRLISGDDITAYSPLAAMGKLNGRPFYITHGTADERLSVDYAADLAAAAQAAGSSVEPWLIDGATHVEGMFLQPDEYERRLVAFFDAALRP
jgi:uncharacterized protein